MYSFLKKSVLTSTVSLFLGSFVFGSPSQAASVIFSNNNFLGDVDVTNSDGQISLTNASNNVSPDLDDESVNYNVSGNNPRSTGDLLGQQGLETFLNLNSGSLGLDATEGSAVKTTLTAFAGDVFSFDWVFRTNEPNERQSSTYPDYAFVTIGSQVITLANIADAITTPGGTLASNLNAYARQINNTFSYTFNTAGTYNVGIGVVDVKDTAISSGLSVRNANIQPVPEPLTILGSGIAAGFGVVLKRKQAKKA